ncbi:MAG: hypothetical protein FWJ61_10530, partial [Limnochordales bacterium]
MTPAAAEMLLIGILAGFFISAVVQQLTSRRGATLDEQTMAELEKVVEEALARKIAAGGFVAAAPGVAAAAPAAAPAAAEAEAADAAPAEADAAAATAEAPAGAAPAGEPVPLIVTTMDGTRHELQVGAGENLLDAALDRNVDLDYSCKEG